jgi:lipid A oxidase
MISRTLRILGGLHVLVVALVILIAFTPPTSRLYGDRLQIALPVLAWGCAVTRRAGGEFALRFGALFVTAHASKNLLGDAAINLRPTGRLEGFPSAHTSAAVLGASSLVNDCISGHPGVKALVLLAAAYVGTSRIDASQHTLWQVLAGALLGWGCDRVLRRDSPARRRVAGWFAAIGRRISSSTRPFLTPLRSLKRSSLTTGAAFCMVILSAVVARAEMELSFYGGIQNAPHSTISHPTLGDDFVRWEGNSLEMPPYYGLRATWWRSETLGFGLDLNHAKVYADNPRRYGYNRLEMTNGLNLLTLNVWRRWPNDGRLTPYLGAGAGVAIPHVEITPRGRAATYGYQMTGPAVQWVAGLSWELDQRWSVFGEYKGTWSSHDIKLDSGGRMETEIITNAINLGLSYRF